MKRIVFLLAIMVIVVSASAQTSKFTLAGEIRNFKAPIEIIYLSYIVNGQRITDSTVVRENKYSFNGNITEAVQAGLRIRYRADKFGMQRMPFNSKRDYAVVFLEPGNIGATSVDSLANITVSGSIADEEYRKLTWMEKPFDDKLSELYKQLVVVRRNRETDLIDHLEKQIDSINEIANDKVYGAYVKGNPGSPLAMYALRNWAGYEIDVAKIEPVFKNLPLAARNSVSGKEMEEKLTIAKKTGIGQMALNFTQNDTLGLPISLTSFHGKYLLLDFWASWCGPCRADNPAVVNVFNKYHKKGFHILSVSLDKPGAKAKWLQAIHDDGLNWSHVSDLKFWDNAVAKEYGIQAIPQNLLLDPTGKIIAKNLHGEALEKKLAAIYSN